MIHNTHNGRIYTGTAVFTKLVATDGSSYAMFGKRATMCDPHSFIVATGLISNMEYIVKKDEEDEIRVTIENTTFRVTGKNKGLITLLVKDA